MTKTKAKAQDMTDNNRKKRAKNGAGRDKRGLFTIGNPGRPKGSLDRRTAPFRAKIDEAMPDILDSVIKAARDGDIQAARILMDKTLPNLKPIEVANPFPVVGDTLTEKAASVIRGTATGEISVDEASRLLQALGSVARIIETDELEKRVSALEARYENKR